VQDGEGGLFHPAKVKTDPDRIGEDLDGLGVKIVRVGLAATGMVNGLYPALANRGVPIDCMAARLVSLVLKANRNKSARTDARGLATMIRTGAQ